VISKKPYEKKSVGDLRPGQWFSPGTPVSFTNKADRHDVAKILLKVTLILPLSLNH